MKHEVAGDPITGLKWTRKTTQKISAELKRLKIDVSANTVGKLLKQMGFSLRVNRKKIDHLLTSSLWGALLFKTTLIRCLLFLDRAL